MLAIILADKTTPVTYCRGSKPVQVKRAKKLVDRLNKRDATLPKQLKSFFKDDVKFYFQVLKSIDELGVPE